ncbi:MAG: hypothetical protein HZA91_04240 [Verrucomicrobia bacterium]|nr:hypothetical protein [Verrucomicrobiota bacterium]
MLNLAWDAPGMTWDGAAPDPQPQTITRTMDNMISAELNTANKTAVLDKLAEIRALMPFLINLTVTEKSTLPKMGTFRTGMDEAFSQEMAAHPELVPNFVDMTELGKDRVLRAILNDIAQQVAALNEAVEDTQTAAGVDTYMAYLSFYNNVKQGAKRNVPGADSVLDNLKRFFPRGGGGTTPTPPTPPTP